MINLIKSLFVSNPLKKLEKERERKYKEAVAFQRNGKLREYADVMKEIEELENQMMVASGQKNSESDSAVVHDDIDYDGMGNQGRFPNKK